MKLKKMLFKSLHNGAAKSTFRCRLFINGFRKSQMSLFGDSDLTPVKVPVHGKNKTFYATRYKTRGDVAKEQAAKVNFSAPQAPTRKTSPIDNVIRDLQAKVDARSGDDPKSKRERETYANLLNYVRSYNIGSLSKKNLVNSLGVSLIVHDHSSRDTKNPLREMHKDMAKTVRTIYDLLGYETKVLNKVPVKQSRRAR